MRLERSLISGSMYYTGGFYEYFQREWVEPFACHEDALKPVRDVEHEVEP
jgi:hypothetical protein